jgi:sialic acid synthase SpsE
MYLISLGPAPLNQLFNWGLCVRKMTETNSRCPYFNKASIEPDELKDMVKAIRNVEKAIGNGIKRPTKNEEEIKNIARRSLVAARDIKAGETVTLNNISIKRPGIGIAPELIEQIINKVAKIDIKKDSLLEWDYFNKRVECF